MTDENNIIAQALAATLGLHHPLQPLQGGRINRVWLSGDIVVKLYAQNGATPLFDNDGKREFAVLRALWGTGLAPEPIELIETPYGTVLTYKYLAGQTQKLAAKDVALLLGRLHALSSPPNLPRLPVGVEIAAEAQRLGVASSAPREPARLCLVHRDPVPGNIIKTVSGLALIDWQTPGLGDPVEDIAHFLSPAMQTLYGTGPLGPNQIDAFLSAYPDQSIVSRYQADGYAFHARLVGYCRWQAGRGNTDYAKAELAENQMLATLSAAA